MLLAVGGGRNAIPYHVVVLFKVLVVSLYTDMRPILQIQEIPVLFLVWSDFVAEEWSLGLPHKSVTASNSLLPPPHMQWESQMAHKL
jgi:hypothetical protein